MKWLAGLLIAVTAILAQTLLYGYVNLDDGIYVQNFSYFSRLENFKAAFMQGFWAPLHMENFYYRPVIGAFTVLMAWMSKMIFNRPSPFLFHLVNLLLLLGVAVLIHRLLTRLAYPRMAVFFATLIFAIHPALSGTVAWLGGANDLLLATFALLSFESFLAFLENHGSIRLLSCLAFMGLGLLTKESAIVLPFLFAFYAAYSKDRRALPRRQWARFVVFSLVLLGGWWVLRLYVNTQSLDLRRSDLESIARNAAGGVLIYLGRWFLPFRLSVLPILKDSTLVFGVLALALIAAITRLRLTRRMVFGLLWFVAFLLPTFSHQVTNPGFQFILREDRLFTASVGLLILSIELGLRLTETFQPRERPLTSAGAVLAFLFACGTAWHLNDYQDDLHFYQAAAAGSPDLAMASNLLGNAWYFRNDLPKAEEAYLHALSSNPYEPMAHNSLGVLYLAEGKLDNAEEQIGIEIRFYPRSFIPYSNLGLVFARKGQIDRAEKMWRKSISLNPDNVEAYSYLLELYKLKGDREHEKEIRGQLDRLTVAPS